MADAPQTKTCCFCKEDLPLESFALKVPAKGARQSRCRACAKVASRASYEKHRESVIKKAAVSKKTQQTNLRQVVASLLVGASCCKCGAAEHLGFKLNDDSACPRVSAAINQGLALETVLASVAESSILCKVCEYKEFGETLVNYMAIKTSGLDFVGSPLTKAQQKERRTRASKDHRRDRFAEGRIPSSRVVLEDRAPLLSTS